MNFSAQDVRRTPGGLPYRVSRSSTPDIDLIKRNVEIENRKEEIRSAPSELFLRLSVLSNPGSAPHVDGAPTFQPQSARDARTTGPKGRAVRPQTARESHSTASQHPSRRPHTARPAQGTASGWNTTGRPLSARDSNIARKNSGIVGMQGAHAHDFDPQNQQGELGMKRPPNRPASARFHETDLSTAQGRFREAIRATRPIPPEPEEEEPGPTEMLSSSVPQPMQAAHSKLRKHQPMGRSKPSSWVVISRFDEMIRSGWAQPDRSLEDALHSDLRKGLATAKTQVGMLQQELDDWKTKFQILEEGCQVWVDRCKGLEESLQSKDDQAHLLDRENQKLLFLIGVREGEIAQLMREIDHLRETRDQTGRAEYEVPPGGVPRPSSPFFNDIDSSAVKLNNELVAVAEDLETRMRLVEHMDVMVAKVSSETKRRVEYEASRRPVFIEQETQTFCGLSDMALLCATNEEPSEGEDPADVMARVMAVAQRRRFQPGVPIAFQGCVMDSRQWQTHKQQRLVQQTPNALQLSILFIYFAKRDTDAVDDACAAPRLVLPMFILEFFLSQSSLKSDCDLRMMDLLGGVAQHSKHPRIRMFARLCGMPQHGDSKTGHALPLETLNFFLQVLHVLHEMMAVQVRRAKMTPKQRAETAVRTDAEVFASKGEPFDPNSNVFVSMTRTEEKISFKKARVCKVIKEFMAAMAQSEWTAADNLPFVEANRLLTLDEALEMAVEVYEEVRLQRRATIVEAFTVDPRSHHISGSSSFHAARSLSLSNPSLAFPRLQLCKVRGTEPAHVELTPGEQEVDVNGLSLEPAETGRPSFDRFTQLLRRLDPERSKHEVMRMYREVCLGSGTADSIQEDALCEVLQCHAVDRPKPAPKPDPAAALTLEGGREGGGATAGGGGRVSREQSKHVGAGGGQRLAREESAEVPQAVLDMLGGQGGVLKSSVGMRATVSRVRAAGKTSAIAKALKQGARKEESAMLGGAGSKPRNEGSVSASKSSTAANELAAYSVRK